MLGSTTALLLAALPLLAGAPEGDDAPAARGGGLALANAELDRVLVRRYALTENGRSALQHLVMKRVLERMAAEREMVVTEEDVERRLAELDRASREAGNAGGVRAQLRESGVDPSEFRELLRVAIVQERLCREALGLPPDAELSGAQQQIWIDAEMRDRGLDAPPPPWPDGVAARCGDVAVTEDDYTAELRRSLPPEQVRDTCHHLLVAKGIRARVPDLAPEAFERELDREIERRRVEAETDPRYHGMPFDRLLSMQGLSRETLRLDPSVHVAALSSAYVQRNYDDEDLREVYAEERSVLDALFGEAVRARLLYLRAAVLVNPLNPRSFSEAEVQLEKLARGIRTEEEFIAAAKEQSEEPRTRSTGGDLGWLTRGGNGLVEVRSAIFADLDARGPVPPGGRVLGPLRMADGVALLWLVEGRSAPSWEVMKEHVRDELRRRLIDDVLPRDGMVTFLDA